MFLEVSSSYKVSLNCPKISELHLLFQLLFELFLTILNWMFH